MTNQLSPLPDAPPPEPPVAPPTTEIPSPAPGASAAPRRRLGPAAAGLLGLCLGAGLVGGIWAVQANSEPGDPGAFTLEGEFALTDSVGPIGDDGCGGLRGYDDIQEGTSVTVYGASGDVVATGALGASTYDRSSYDCTFEVAVSDVPKGEKFYKVEVSHRGTLQLSAKEAEGGEFAAGLG
ncbi:hypothetical protein [Streptomyces sp. MMBL 11-3]|uniref:hypothetical protein n=1 Tax=Streptomyces sp. MMBL 11-3 TaxID=3382639 RepID=UPI0039B38F02